MLTKGKVAFFARIFSCLLVVLVLFAGCKDIKDIIDAIFGQNSENPILVQDIKAPTGISFIEVSDSSYRQVDTVMVTFIDPLGKVRSSNGMRIDSVKVTGGVMSIGLDKDVAFDENDPYRFWVKAEAKGYMTHVKCIVIRRDEANYRPIFLAKLNALPRNGGLSFEGKIVANLTNNHSTNGFNIDAYGINRDAQSMKIVFPDDLTFIPEEKGAKLEGPLTSRLLVGTRNDSVSNLVFPCGFELSDSTPYSKPTKPAVFTTLGWFSLEMSASGKKVKGFSNDVWVEMPILPTINPNTREPFNTKDTVPLWSHNNNTGKWRKERDVTLQMDKSTGRLIARFPITHLSSWVLAVTSNPCPDTVILTYPGTITPNFLDTFVPTKDYYTRYVNLRTGAVVKEGVLRGSQYFPRSPFTIINAPSNIDTNYRLIIHNGSDPYRNPVGWESSEVNCALNGRIGGKQANNKCVLIEVKLASNNFPHCKNALWYKDACSDSPVYPFFFAGVLNNGQVYFPYNTNPQMRCLRLWYTKAPNQEDWVKLGNINFNDALQGQQSTVGTKSSGGGNHTVTYEISTLNTSGCEYKITIQVPTSLVQPDGSSCPPPQAVSGVGTGMQ